MTACPTCGSVYRGPSVSSVKPVDGRGRVRARHNRRSCPNPSIRLHWPVQGAYAHCPDPWHQAKTDPLTVGGWRSGCGRYHYRTLYGNPGPAVDPATLPVVGRRRIDRRAWAGKKAFDAIVHKVAQGKDRR